MKRKILLSLTMCTALGVTAQNKISGYTPTPSSISVIDLGQSANAYSVGVRQRTCVWADPRINAVSFIHRAGASPGSGFLQADFSTDGGATWTKNAGPLYSPGTGKGANIRYPQGLIYNPPGNTVADSAFVTYCGATLNNTNALGWGGNALGSWQMSGLHPATQKEDSTDALQKLFIPRGMTITKQGVLYVLDAAYRTLASGSNSFTDTLILTIGNFNPAKKGFDYQRKFLRAPSSLDTTTTQLPVGYADWRIAFAPDGVTGYIALLTHNSYAFQPAEAYYPVVYKTADGGTTWTGPINIDLKPLVDPTLKSPAGKYTTGFEVDVIVDANGNPHLVTGVHETTNTPWTVSIIPGHWGIFDLYSEDGGSNWKAHLLEKPMSFRATYKSGTDELDEDNHPQASSTMDGTKLFFTWFDTDTAAFPTPDNLYPDMKSVGYNEVTKKWTAVKNFTQGTDAYGLVTFGNVSQWVFDNTPGTYEIPAVYQVMTPSGSPDILQPVQYKYIKGATFTDAEFVLSSVNELENESFALTQNYPNPFHNYTSIDLQLKKTCTISIEIYDVMGQKLISDQSKHLSAGTYTMNIDGSNLSPGIYFYVVRTEGFSVTRRMLVE
jgi:hypothetical protein